MKAIKFLSLAAMCLALSLSACKSSNVVEFTTENDDEISAQIREMYLGCLYYDYEFLEQHCSADLLKKLTDAYEYDYEPGQTVYAGWLFRSDSQDAFSGEILRLWKEGDWYYYEGNDGDDEYPYKFINRVRASVRNGVVVFEDLENVKNSSDYVN